MKLLKLSLAALTLAAAFTSCKKDTEESSVNNQVTSTKEMVVPDNFDYSNSRTVDYSFSNTSQWSKEKLRLDLYDFNPYGGGDLIESKFLKADGTLSGSVKLPNTVKTVYAVLRFPDGSSTMAVIKANGNSFNYDFSVQKSLRKTAPVSPNCNSGCGTTVNNNNGWYDADQGGVYCFTGKTKGGINVKNGSTVRICGTGTFQISIQSGGKVEIVDGANVSITNFGVNSDADHITIYQNAIVEVKNWASPNSKVINYGNLSFQNLGINSGCDFTNYGYVEIKGNSQWHTVSGTLINNGTFDCTGNLTQNSSGAITNNCKMIVDKQLTVNATFDNYSYVKVSGLLQVNSSGNMKLHDGAMTWAEDIYMDGTIEGVGSTSLLKLNNQISGNSSAKIKGNLEFCDLNGVEVAFSGAIEAPASLACDNVYIATSACNPAGNGSPQIADDDNDGVANDVDLYPNDPNASGALYYPGNNQFATIAFEDLWPYAGDYDFNDLVVGYNYTMVTNANNDVVRIEAKFVTKAIGASFANGFGVQLGCSSSAVSSVSGNQLTEGIINESSNGTEQGQSKATVVVYDNAFKTIKDFGGTRFVNTRNDEAVKTPDTIDVVITFNNAISQNLLGAAPFNPFIFIDGERGKEVHLADHEPTDLADNSYFGVGADDTQVSNGKFYKTEKNHPWAINVEGGFDYPLEKEDIVTAYSFFATWAQSAGALSEDWYVNLSGYRNASKVY